MEPEYTIEVVFSEEKDSVDDKLVDLIRKNDQLRVEEPAGALGVVEVGTIVIAVAAGYELATSLVRDINLILADDETITKINNVEQTARWFIQNHAQADADSLILNCRKGEGPRIEMIFSDDNAEYWIVINRFDVELNEVQFQID